MAVTPSLNKESHEKISLKKPSPSRGKLFNLSAEQQALLVDWMMSRVTYAVILERVRTQFGVSFNSTVPLERFWRKVCRPMLLKQQSEQNQVASRISSSAKRDIKKLIENPNANIEELKEALRQVAASPEKPPAKPADPARSKEMTIDESNPLDDQDKLDEIRRQVFGSAPNPD